MSDDAKGTQVGTADLHGSTIRIDTGNGEKTTFELVRVGTLKEHKVVKAALETSRDDVELGRVSLITAKQKLASMTEKRDAAEAAYSTEKEVSAELTKAIQGLAEGIQRQKDTIFTMTRELESANAELSGLMTVKASLEETNTALETSERHLCESRASFDTLRDTVKGFLEEQKTPLETLMAHLESLTGE